MSHYYIKLFYGGKICSIYVTFHDSPNRLGFLNWECTDISDIKATCNYSLFSLFITLKVYGSCTLSLYHLYTFEVIAIHRYIRLSKILGIVTNLIQNYDFLIFPIPDKSNYPTIFIFLKIRIIRKSKKKTELSETFLG